MAWDVHPSVKGSCGFRDIGWRIDFLLKCSPRFVDTVGSLVRQQYIGRFGVCLCGLGRVGCGPDQGKETQGACYKLKGPGLQAGPAIRGQPRLGCVEEGADPFYHVLT